MDADKTAIFLFLAFTAAVAAAITLGYIAHYDFGLSRQEIQSSALTAAALIGLLLATEYLSKGRRKPK